MRDNYKNLTEGLVIGLLVRDLTCVRCGTCFLCLWACHSLRKYCVGRATSSPALRVFQVLVLAAQVCARFLFVCREKFPQDLEPSVFLLYNSTLRLPFVIVLVYLCQTVLYGRSSPCATC